MSDIKRNEMFPLHDFLDVGPRDAPRYIVEYSHSESNSWLGLPPSLAGHLYGSRLRLPVVCAVAVQLPMGLPPLPPLYLSWAGASCDTGRISIQSRIAALLDIPQGAEITVSPLPGVPDADALTVEPASPDDWEIVELNASALEEELLTQTGVASTSQPLAVWVNNQLVALKVIALTPPAEVVRLVAGTEVHVAPRIRVNDHVLRPSPGRGAIGEGTSGRASGPASVTALLRILEWECLPNGNDDGDAECVESNREEYSKLIENGNSSSLSLPKGTRAAYISPRTLRRCGLEAGDVVEIRGPGEKLVVSQLVSQSKMPLGHVGLQEVSISLMDGNQFDSVAVRKLCRFERDAVLQALAQSSPSNSSIEGESSASLVTNVSPSGNCQSWRPPMTLNPSNSSRKKPACASNIADAMSQCSQSALAKALEQVLPVIAAGPRSVLQRWGVARPGSVLIEGPSGSGKTSLARTLSVVLSQHPQCLVAVETVPCKEIHSLQDAKSRIDDCFTRAIARLPSLVVLDDLDILCPADGEGAHPDDSHAMDDGGLVNYLCEVIDAIMAADERWLTQAWDPWPGRAGLGAWAPLAVVATCREAAGLPPLLREPGRFESLITLEPPCAQDRAAMLSAGVVKRGARASASAVQSVAVKADGFDGADIGVLIDRAIGLAVSRRLRDSGSGIVGGGLALQVTLEDLEGGLDGLIPAAFWGAGTRKSVQAGIEGWEDVGGLSEVRDALQEALELPLRYPTMVAQAPLRLRTGALLYGPPGCGKTHIIAAAVAASGVRCISISGPELLNKYIGASEAAVRDVFRRAAAAAPCVLFFDEFDAIAPQRGHDNTGVSDRVVNQLLTELDGVEGLRGVSVVAATSRPDLLDAALLRPGRLDRLLYCGFPSPSERGSVLRALSRRLSLEPDVDLDAVAARAEGFSGADLGALLSEAQLAAAHEALEFKESFGARHINKPYSSKKDSYSSGSGDEIGVAAGLTVARRHMDVAVEAARPSVSEAERARLQKIYNGFERGSLLQSSGSSADADKGKSKMVTWA